MLNQKKDANIDSRLKYLRQKIMTYMQSGAPYVYQTGIGIEIDKLNNALEQKLNDTKEKLRFEIEKNNDSQSVTSVKTTIDLQIVNGSGVQWKELILNYQKREINFKRLHELERKDLI